MNLRHVLALYKIDSRRYLFLSLGLAYFLIKRKEKGKVKRGYYGVERKLETRERVLKVEKETV